ncbi:MAG: MCE family protein [Candidatus Omnitrophica bacterium]|nr:MCE family protein [Candidatus Omnitrophota bacterium]
MRKAGLELKVGIFVVTAIGVLLFLIFKAGDFYLKPGYTVRFIFSTISGVTKGSPIRLAGVDIGEVKEIRVVRGAEGKTQAEVYARIVEGMYIEEDSEVRINSLGLLGEKYIEIIPGVGGAKTIPVGGTLFGKESIALDDLTTSGTRLISKIEFAVDNIGEVVSDPEFKASLKGTFTHADKAALQFSEMMADLKEAAASARVILARLREGEGTIGHLLKNKKIAENLEAFTEDIKANPWKLLKKG